MWDWLDVLLQVDPWTVLASALDIFIVSYIIYRVLLLIRRTRAAYTLVGLLVVAGVFVLANRLSLTTLSWLLDNVINYIILIVIIVFQADIRQGLMRVGRRMFSSSRVSDEIWVIDEVVKACEVLADKRVGALIVFERGVGLAEVVEPGVFLDARVSQPLLYTIFTPWPDNPLHDGAVIIRNNTVHQAAAVLPLSRNPGLDKALGTRHRAGIGVTEESDAVSIVVSEQRGTISLCTGGLLHMSLRPHALRRELLARLTKDVRTRWRWLEWLLRLLELRFGWGEDSDAGKKTTSGGGGGSGAGSSGSPAASTDGGETEHQEGEPGAEPAKAREAESKV